MLSLTISPARLLVLESGDRVLEGLLTGKSVEEASIHLAKSTGLGIAIIKKNPYRVFEDPLNALVDTG